MKLKEKTKSVLLIIGILILIYLIAETEVVTAQLIKTGIFSLGIISLLVAFKEHLKDTGAT